MATRASPSITSFGVPIFKVVSPVLACLRPCRGAAFHPALNSVTTGYSTFFYRFRCKECRIRLNPAPRLFAIAREIHAELAAHPVLFGLDEAFLDHPDEDRQKRQRQDRIPAQDEPQKQQRIPQIDRVARARENPALHK